MINGISFGFEKLNQSLFIVMVMLLMLGVTPFGVLCYTKIFKKISI